MCGNAGFWQLRRKKWKEGVIQERKDRVYSEPLPVGLPLPALEEFTPVSIQGTLQHQKEMLILKKNGGRNGFSVITPLLCPSGQSILVNRGWIPMDLKALPSRAELNTDTSVTGVLRKSSAQGKFTPANSPSIEEWYYIDIPQMSKSAGLNETQDYYLHSLNYERSRELCDEEDLPEIPVRTSPVELMQWTITPATHLSYAIFWFGSSLICLYFNIRLFR